MEWDVVVAALASSGITAGALNLLADSIGKHYSSNLERAEANHQSTLNRVESLVQSQLTRAEDSHRSELSRAEETYKSALAVMQEVEKAALAQAAETHKMALAVTQEIDINLRTLRLDAYEALWKKTEKLPRWPERDDFTYEELDEFSGTLRDWYFAQGGIFLSENARRAYGIVQDSIWLQPGEEPTTLPPGTTDKVKANHGKRGVIWTGEAHDPKGKKSGILSPDEYSRVREACSLLRTWLTRDIESRRPGPLPDEE